MASKDGMIDLGREYNPCGPCDSSSDGPSKGKKKISYPSLYITGVKGLDIDTGEITFTARGKVVSISKRDKGVYPDADGDDDGDEYSCDIEVHAISIPGASADDSEEGLGKALDKISKKKVADDAAEDAAEDAADGGADEDEEDQ